MLAGEAQQAMKTWLSQAPLPEQKLDWRWIVRQLYHGTIEDGLDFFLLSQNGGKTMSKFDVS